VRLFSSDDFTGVRKRDSVADVRKTFAKISAVAAMAHRDVAASAAPSSASPSDAQKTRETKPHLELTLARLLELKRAGQLASLGLAPNELELYLSADDFAVALGMPRSEFENLPKWKRDAKKKAAGLF